MRPRLAIALAACLVSLLVGVPSAATDPEERLEDPALEARARALAQEIRCVVCQGQTIDDSNAPVAKALREMVRARLLAGDTDAEVIDAVAARYGEFVLLRPRFNGLNAVLWFGPAVVLLLGGLGAVVYIRKHRGVAPAHAAPLTAEEEDALQAALKDDR